MYSNSQILAAVLNKWMQPILDSLLASKMQSFGFLTALENKIKATGWVSGKWSIMQDLSPLVEGISGSIVTPVLSQYISMIDDANVPVVAHQIIDKWIESGEVVLLEGKVTLELADLQELKRLLNINLPLTKNETPYEVKMN